MIFTIPIADRDKMAAFFIGRIPDLKLPPDRKEALATVAPLHEKILKKLYEPFSFSTQIPFVTAEQIHGSEVALVKPPFSERMKITGVDGLITTHQDVILGIMVADCAPVWIVEKTGKIGALLHSGKRGTEAGIVQKTIVRITQEFQIPPEDLIVTIGPCIRPPCYEIDFAQTIREQASALGVTMIHDEKICTACHPDRYYSYRREKGQTGNMLATLMILPTSP
ncbi:MAG TPA: polyphenol oxidase family protein [Chthoniobacterales bacterium]|nr:polyphenol oxidase family protein [Chthoniobacterales bacterium]